MARQTEVIEHMLDDIDGGKADETVQFTYEGTTYALDLSKKNAKAFHTDLARWASYGAKVKPTQGRKRGTAAKSPTVDTAAVRAWAADNGIEVSPRGRVAASVVDAYQASLG